MRHAPITFADDVAGRAAAGETWDAVFCSDMLNLHEFLGLAPEAARRLPAVAYFHENQLTYPYQFEDERDYQYCFSNMATALAATEVWFNSAFHRDEFLDAIPAFLKKMPDHQPWDIVERIRAKSRVRPPGIAEPRERGPRAPGPIRILWAARWEHDKDPDTFFEALALLKARGVGFRVSVIGEQFLDAPTCFERAKQAGPCRAHRPVGLSGEPRRIRSRARRGGRRRLDRAARVLRHQHSRGRRGRVPARPPSPPRLSRSLRRARGTRRRVTVLRRRRGRTRGRTGQACQACGA